ncbi:hypothetical protein BGLT_07006 [Caballeronia glathei]|nr:methyltransferase domain-containing protein [Caballeronia glathei]CEJ96027.1 hypothetical protein BGLT_07006 [Caballeronia glathei]
MVKVDLGCGLAKSPGFIGVDRAPMPGVDVVADLNKRLPFEDDSVDLIVASHSLEHVADITATMKELYRICKHGAQICIIAPYFEQKLNVANPYHIVPFNEHTARFFTSSRTAGTDSAQYWHPHAVSWGLAESDNSHLGVDFRLAGLEFFYFPEFLGLSEENKLFARRHMWDVCDQMVCQLVVWKKSDASDEAVREEIETMSFFEPAFINERRKKDATLIAQQGTRAPVMQQIKSALGELLQPDAAMVSRVDDLHRACVAIEDSRSKVRAEMDGRLAQMHSAIAGNTIEIADLKVAAAEVGHARRLADSEMSRMRAELEQLAMQVTATRDSLDRQQAEYRRQQNELAAARRALDCQRHENGHLTASLKEQARAVEHASATVSMQSVLLHQAWADAISWSNEALLYKRRRVVRLTNWFRGGDNLAPNLPPAFSGLLGAISAGARVVLGDDLRGRPFNAYSLRPGIGNPRTLEIGVHVAVKNLADSIGVEIVTGGDRIVFHQTISLDHSWDHGPVRFSLEGLALSSQEPIELRLFSPAASSPIFPIEVRRGRGSRKRSILCRWS